MSAASYWVPPQGKLYLPPPKPVTKVLETDAYVKSTNIYYIGSSERLLTVGNPFFEVRDHEKVTVPKVSGNQYRVFRVLLPDPNKFALQDPTIYNPDNERLVWRLVGLEIGRGGPLGFGNTGNPLLNRDQDAENSSKYTTNQEQDERSNIAVDPKQTQMFVVGCTPCQGTHWDIAKHCANKEPQKGDCPPIELVSTFIEDGQMCDIGYGALNFKDLDDSKAGVPMDIAFTTCKWPDFLKMNNDTYGDSCFFFGKREQVYCRHMFIKGGIAGETVANKSFPQGASPRDTNPTNANWFGTPSGSLVTSDTQLFNRPYWLSRAQGRNNGICWRNNLFVTVVDNTRNVNFGITKYTQDSEQTYDAKHYKHYARHVEEYELSFIVVLCKITLDPDILSMINTMNPAILDEWNLGFVPPPVSGLESTYRFIDSLATKCPDQVEPKEKEDPLDKLNFWIVDLKEKLSMDLEQHSLGRKFLSQTGIQRRSTLRALKRPSSSTKRSVAKKKKRN
ncbi:L1 [Canine papillomavirus 22]|uniref:L1 n=1 Tax=Canine papillomavirus 22 TaxID=2304620 RepID=UPI000E36007A|nr:L1 [Canine papillomavirus 22]AXQ03956.1 L1 [Canine papillomavirus 22]